jgi:integrase
MARSSSIRSRVSGGAQLELPRGLDGKRQRRTVYAATQTQLRRDVADLRAQHGGTVAQRSPDTLASYMARWLAESVKPNRSAKTYEAHETCWRLHAGPVLGAVRLDKLRPEHVANLYAVLRAKGRSSDAVHRVARIMNTALESAIKSGACPNRNPFQQVQRPRHRAQEKTALTHDEVERLLKAAQEIDDRFSGLWILLVLTGLRIGEALGLTWADVSLENATVSVLHSVGEVNGVVVVGPPKTKGSRRRVDLGHLAVQALRRRLSSATTEGFADKGDFVFPSASDKAMSQRNLRRRSLIPILDRAHLPQDTTPHSLRHTHASIAMTAGLSPKIVAARLGHTTTRMTMDIYSHLTSLDGERAASTIEDHIRMK